MTNEYYAQSERLNKVIIRNENLEEEVERLVGIISIQNSDIKTYLKKTRIYEQKLDRLLVLAEGRNVLGDIIPENKGNGQNRVGFNSI